jgi:hypothetical protein
MDLEEYWQENKSFVAQVAGGLFVFLIGLAVVQKTVGAEYRSVRREIVSAESKLRKLKTEGYDRSALDRIKADHAALDAALVDLRERVRFEAREDFRAEPGQATPSAYLSAVTQVRERLLPAAGRKGVTIDPTLGLPELSPTRPDEIERHLEALDLIERVLGLCIEEGVREVPRLRIRLDPGLRGRKGVGLIERTKVEIDMRGENAAILRVLARSQRGPSALAIESIEMDANRQRPDEARAQVTLLTPRIANPIEDVES